MNHTDGQLIDFYLDRVWAERGLSQNTLDAYRRDLEYFANWLEKSSETIKTAQQFTLQAYLAHRFSENYSPKSTSRALSCLRGFYRWLLRERQVDQDPTALLENPKLGRSLPKSLTENDVAVKDPWVDVLRKTEMVLLESLATTMSILPSPSMSPRSMAQGLKPVANTISASNMFGESSSPSNVIKNG